MRLVVEDFKNHFRVGGGFYLLSFFVMIAVVKIEREHPAMTANKHIA
jgi:hypothetical protein